MSTLQQGRVRGRRVVWITSCASLLKYFTVSKFRSDSKTCFHTIGAAAGKSRPSVSRPASAHRQLHTSRARRTLLLASFSLAIISRRNFVRHCVMPTVKACAFRRACSKYGCGCRDMIGLLRARPGVAYRIARKRHQHNACILPPQLCVPMMRKEGRKVGRQRNAMNDGSEKAKRGRGSVKCCARLLLAWLYRMPETSPISRTVGNTLNAIARNTKSMERDPRSSVRARAPACGRMGSVSAAAGAGAWAGELPRTCLPSKVKVEIQRVQMYKSLARDRANGLLGDAGKDHIAKLLESQRA